MISNGILPHSMVVTGWMGSDRPCHRAELSLVSCLWTVVLALLPRYSVFATENRGGLYIIVDIVLNSKGFPCLK